MFQVAFRGIGKLSVENFRDRPKKKMVCVVETS